MLRETISLRSRWCFFALGLVIFPSRQCAAPSRRFAFASDSPFSFGTTQRVTGGGGVCPPDCAAVTAIVGYARSGLSAPSAVDISLVANVAVPVVDGALAPAPPTLLAP